MDEPRIETVDAFDIVGMTIFVAPGEEPRIGAMWGDFIPRKAEIEARDDVHTYGLCWTAATEPGQSTEGFHYLAAAPVQGDVAVPDGMVRRTIEGGRYLVFTHHGGIETYPQTLAKVYGEWLPASDHEHLPTGDFELYDERFCPGEGETQAFDLYVRIR